MDYLIDQSDGTFPFEGSGTRKCLIENRTYRKNIRACIDLLAGYLFGGHVIRCSQDSSGGCHGKGGKFGYSEIHNLHLPFSGNDDICRLYVPMNYSLMAGSIQCLQYLLENGKSLFNIQNRTLPQNFRQRPADDVLHADVLEFLCIPIRIDGDDIRVGQSAGCLCLLNEPPASFSHFDCKIIFLGD